MTDDLPWPAWQTAAANPEISATIRNIYTDLDAQVATHAPVCWASGRCCHFDQFKQGHHLYVTGLETAWVLQQLDNLPINPNDIDPAAPCPYQDDTLCSIHQTRPFGCRLFFCQRGTEDWQQHLYEQTLARFKDLHRSHNIPYHYLEWRSALQQAAQARNEARP